MSVSDSTRIRTPSVSRPVPRARRVYDGAHPQPVRHAVSMSATTVEMCRTEDLSHEVRRAVIDVCNAANETDAFERLFAPSSPSGARHFIGRLDDRLVSHAVVTTRGVQSPPGPVLRTA